MALYRGGEARAIDAAAIAAGLPAFTLMQRAGAAAFASLRRHWPQARCIAILCGGGNNGGDGYVLARLLQADGCQVRVFALTAARTHEAQRAAAEWMEAGGRIEPIDAETEFGSFDLLVDAIFARDYPVVQGCLLFTAIMYVLVNLAVDLLYPVFDPRVTAE